VTIELSLKELEKWMFHAMTDTGFVARELLGFNYDLDWKTGRRVNDGTGGIRNEPPYTLMTELMQDPDERLVEILAPRGGLKSSCLTADCVRDKIANPDFATLMMSGTDPQVRTKSRAIRKVFDKSEQLRQVFKVDSLRGEPWTVDEWTLSIRQDHTITDPSFKTGSLIRIPTGGHYHRIYLDDLIDWRNCRTPEQLELAKKILHLIMPLRVPGAKIIVTGTRYNPGDIYSYIDSMPGWKKLILGCGFEVEEGKDGLWTLRGDKPMFPHLTKEYLTEQLRTMSFEEFCSQYLNRHVAGLSQAFKREWFQPLEWDNSMTGLTTWIVTDAATSVSKTACLSVAVVVGLDSARRIYLLDAFVGKVEPGQYVDELFALHTKWSARTQMTGWTMETVTLTQVLKSWLDAEARRRGLRLNIRDISRSGGERSKDERIKRLQPKLRAKELFVVSTFPTTYRDQQKVKVLWDPVGFTDSNTQERLPSGELVEEFAQFPYYPWKDIADALADIEYVYKSGEQACYYRKPAAAPQLQQRIDSRPAAGQDWISRLGRAPR
jgi:hypothetical protein